MHQPVIAIDGLALAEIANHDGQYRGRQLVLENVDVVAKGDRILELAAVNGETGLCIRDGGRLTATMSIATDASL